MNPDDYGPGEYESARDRIREQQEVNTAAIERASTAESTPHRTDYDPLLVSLMDAWDDMKAAEINALLKQVVRRVAVSRVDGDVVIEVHPVWEPDPWD